MKLGKALATGFAEERQQPRPEEAEPLVRPGRPVPLLEERQDTVSAEETPAAEEVPAAR
ncbi:hypothetical protein [Streptomyces sp. Tu 6176]|uniref:hypothetical protein n=1 Tax=Streptomyces sp. Tu 6176 TaxID=1470557 RepID=UPI0018F88620|nr:hypothetical protein [Streptomyces sp. Tu 6176]